MPATNPRYLAYCRAHNATPDEMMGRDVIAWPGGKMCGFILWIGAQWRRWATERNERPGTYRGPAEHADFDAWLLASATVAA